jgi:hypothetical protein
MHVVHFHFLYKRIVRTHYTDEAKFGDILAFYKLESNHRRGAGTIYEKGTKRYRNNYLILILKHGPTVRISAKEFLIQRTKVERAEISRQALHLIEAPHIEKVLRKKP